MKSVSSMLMAGVVCAALAGCRGDGVDNDDMRTSRTSSSTRIDSDGDRVSKTSKTTVSDDGDVRKTTTIRRSD